MRGTQLLAWPACRSHWIIPADAGNTPREDCTKSHEQDHPRGCGEHSTPTSIFFTGTGSSPRMRGTPAGHVVRAGESRIIPADAGNTTFSIIISNGSQDHPRGCGEHRGLSGHWAAGAGSSARMGGPQNDTGAVVEVDRIIPADAGNTNYSMATNSEP